MVKKIIVIFISAILLIADISIKSNYNYDSTKIVTRNTYTYNDLVTKYVSNLFDELKNGKYDKVYAKMENSNFDNVEEFSKYIIENILVKDSLVSTVDIYESNDDIYIVNVKVDPPIFTTYEKMKLEQYKQKYFNLKIQLNGLFDYKILEFEKVE